MTPTGQGTATAKSLVLNVGAGTQEYGDVRVDFEPSLNTTLVCDASRGLPFQDGAFSQVYSRCLFEHLRNPGMFLDEVFRVLRPGGKLVLITDHASYWRWHFQIDHACDYHHRSSRDRHYALFSPGHLRNFCEASGFYNVTVEYEDFGPEVRLGKDRILGKIPGLRFLSKPRLRLVALKPMDWTQR